MMDHDALQAHARDELGINEFTKANPLQAAFASGAAFVFGGALPVLVALIAPFKTLIYIQYGSALLFLMSLGAFAAHSGGSPVLKSILRITFWGTAAMGLTAWIGHFFEVNI